MKADHQEGNLIVKLTFDFALSIIEYAEHLQNEKRYQLIS